MYLPQVYVGLGGNIGDSRQILNQAIQKLINLPHVIDLNVSRFYKTSPVSHISQSFYINAACCFKTSWTAQELLSQLQEIERILGREKKIKDAPRVIDLDILFYGQESINEAHLKIPHPRWSERLFVVTPLADLTDILSIPDPMNPKSILQIDLKKYLKNFPNIHHETVIPLTEG